MVYISGLVHVLLFPKIIKVTEKRKKKGLFFDKVFFYHRTLHDR